MECYRRAEPNWARRHEVRAQSDETWKRGIGIASQIWYGGGGPPSYAWVRFGSDGRVNVVTGMQDIGTGTRTAMAQIAAEELGLALDRVEVRIGDSARGPVRGHLRRLLDPPVDGPGGAGRRADAARQILEIAAQRSTSRSACSRSKVATSSRATAAVAARGDHRPLEDTQSSARARAARIRRHARPHVRRAVRGGGRRRRDRRGRVDKDRRGPRRRARVNPLGPPARSRAGSFRPLASRSPRSGSTIRGRARLRRPRRVQDADHHRRAGDRRELVDATDEHLTNLGVKGLGEPPIIPTAAAIANAIATRPARRSRRSRSRARRSCGRSRGAKERTRPLSSCGLSRSTSSRRSRDGVARLPVAPSSSRCLRDGLVALDTFVDIAPSCRAGSTARESIAARGRRSPSSRSTRRSPTRCARRAGSPPRRSCATWAPSAATCCRRRAAGTGA